MRQVQLDKTILGKLYLHSMPARYETWEAFCKESKDKTISTVVCLTSIDEIAKLSPDYAEAIQSEQLPFEKVTTAITDFGVPKNEEAFFMQIKNVAASIKNGGAVLIHCAAGIGRTGMFANCLLQALGMDEAEAIEIVKAAGSGPETEIQRDLVSRFKVCPV